jgi:hypothetical protein
LSPARLDDDIRTAFSYARVEGDGRMNLSVIILGGVVAGTSAFAPQCAAQTPARTGATVVSATTPSAAVKKPGAKPDAAAAQSGGTVVSPATMPSAALKKPAAKPGLALVHLYGAHNLAPAPFAENNIASGDLTLIGVADPLVQNSDAVTVAPARLSQQTIEPPPKSGFSGAAAADARGRLVGMVDLRPGILAGNGAGAAQTVTIVPVETIRAFLQAQQIAPAGTPAAAINQSVVRVICVRK